MTGAHVQPEGGIRLGVALEQALLDHHARPVIALLAGLEHEHHATGRELARRATSMRAALTSIATWVSCPQACMAPATSEANGRPGVFLQGQGVHVGAQQHRGARPAALERGHDRGRLLAGARLQTETVERLQHRLLGAGQGEADLGVAMDAAAECDRVVQQAAGLVEQRRVIPSHRRRLLARKA